MTNSQIRFQTARSGAKQAEQVPNSCWKQKIEKVCLEARPFPKAVVSATIQSLEKHPAPCTVRSRAVNQERGLWIKKEGCNLKRAVS